ncbi:phospholipase D-like domain-containing protein [Sporosalibacterium faouarense]|uniref:phospholipase D-like domain-containing protein n=1 Tax=Sporosalibacterium faouarense TaxID=516123 RepID=UPI00192ACC84|nr:phospholipase D-like domain-containing protein [Sporosalibacterium faouarense]
MKKLNRLVILAMLLILVITGCKGLSTEKDTLSSREIVISEIAWMGTTKDYNDEWIELYNTSNNDINLSGWTLKSKDGTPTIELKGIIPAKGYFLLERSKDDCIPDLKADLIYSGALSNSGESLYLKDRKGKTIDTINSWIAGNNESKATMDLRNHNSSDSVANDWGTSTEKYSLGYGTPRNSRYIISNDGLNEDKDIEDNKGLGNSKNGELGWASNSTEAINVYFNKSALTEYAISGNEANYNVNLEERLIHRISEAKVSIDMATYEINLPRVVDALINKASEGVKIRIIADAKEIDESNFDERYALMRIYLEKMLRGKDGRVGTTDDIAIFSDSPIFAVKESNLRDQYNLPLSFNDVKNVKLMINDDVVSGNLLSYGEQKKNNSFYAPNDQMHNKFVVVDDTWVWTGSWNFTITGLYGSEENMKNGILGGNQQHSVEIKSHELATIYETEFNEMWGSNDLIPNAEIANLHSRKSDNTVHKLSIGESKVEVYFSPGDNALGRMAEIIKNEADHSVYFEIFSWSDQRLLDEVKYKWEQSYEDSKGILTGFDVKGLFDGSYWDQWWSASVDMTGRKGSMDSKGNKNNRWANPAPVFPANEERKLHAKTMIIDADTDSNPTVIVGSTNWSNNGNYVNDENMLIIYDRKIVNQFLQEFYARYKKAAGWISQ